jgi:hypothetical protein
MPTKLPALAETNHDEAVKPLDWTAQLVMLREMTKRFGSLHEAQSLQLKLWPFTVDSTIANSQAKVDIEGKTVEFNWIGSKMKVDKKYQERLNALNSNVKFLLGEEWVMVVKSDGTPIFPIEIQNAGSSQKRKRKRSNRRSGSKPNRKRSRKSKQRARKGRR